MFTSKGKGTDTMRKRNQRLESYGANVELSRCF